MFLRRLSPYCIPLCLAPLLSVAAVSAMAAEPQLLQEIVVEGQALPVTGENLNLREVRESPARDIGQALEALPGLTAVRKGAIASDPVLRGFQGDDLNLLMDGVRVHGGCPSRMDPPSFHFDFAEVESIDVVKGPYSLRYPGSLGGLIAIKGKAIEPGAAMTAAATYGSYELFHASATGSYGGDRAQVLGGYAYKYSLPPKAGDGRRITDLYPATSPNRYRPEHLDSRAYDINSAWLKGGARLGERLTADLGFAWQEAGHVLYPGLLMDAEYDTTRRFDGTLTAAGAGVLETLEFQAYRTEVEHLMNDRWRESSRPSMMVTRDVMMETDAETSVTGAALVGQLLAGEAEVTFGLDGYRRTWDAVNVSAMWLAYTPQPMIPDVDSDLLGFFVEAAHPLGEQWLLKGGARLDRAWVEAGKLDAARLAALYQPYLPGATPQNSTDFLEASANLQLYWMPSAELELFAGVASVARTPDPQELYIGLQRTAGGNWVGNPELEPVRNQQLDLGLKLKGERFVLGTSLFYSLTDDYITLVALPDPDGAGPLTAARSYRNIDAWRWGGEISAQLALPRDLYLLADLSYTRGEERDSDTPLAEMPPLMGSVGLRYDVDRYFAEITERFADRQDQVDPALLEEETPGWAVTNLKAGVTLKAWRIVAGIDNLFDKFYVPHLSYQRDPFRSGVKVPESGRFGYLTVSCSF